MSPSNYQGVAIGRLCHEISTWNPAVRGGDQTFTYIDIGALDQEAKVVREITPMPCDQAPSRARQLVRAGDVLVSTVRPNLNAVAVVPPELDGATASTGFCVLRPNPAECEGRYLFNWVKSSSFIDSMVRLATGASYPAVSDRIVKDSLIPLPPLSEQRRIAAILDQADSLRAKRRSALAKLDTLAQSIFIEMFGDPVTNSKRWPIRAFDEVCRDETSRSEWIPQSDYLSVGKFPVIDQGKEYLAGYCNDVDKLTQSNLPCVVFGDHTRTVKLVREPFVVGAQGAKVLVPNEGIMAPYLAALLPLLPLPDLGYSRHMRELKRLEFPCPPKPIQELFISKHNEIEKMRGVENHHLEQIDALFASLQHRAFRGEL